MDDPQWAVTARIVRLLEEAGAPAEEVAAAVTIEQLVDLAGDVGIRPSGAPLSLTELAAAARLPVDRVAQLVRAVGLEADERLAPRWFTSDVAWVQGAEAAGRLFGERAVLALLHRAGAAMAQLVHASGAAFRVNVVGRAWPAETPELGMVQRNLATRQLIDSLVQLFGQVFRHHARTSVRMESVAAGDFGELRDMAVGFVDMTASSRLGESVSAAALAGVVNDFNDAVFDAAVRAGVRVVKTIGDEAMFVADDATSVCRAALHLVAYCADHPVIAGARGGVAEGPVLDQDGDCYGPVVNRAARFAEAAPDGAVMADAHLADRLGPDLRMVEGLAVAHRGLGTRAWGHVFFG